MAALKMSQHASKPIYIYPATVSPTAQLMKERLEVMESKNETDAFVVVDLGQAFKKLEEFKKFLPRVRPFYAMKCNPDPQLCTFLAQAGVGFDCASKGEIQQILNLGVHPSRIVYANPYRAISHLTYALDHGVDLLTFDDVSELVKIQKYFPKARLLLRIQSCKKYTAKFNLNQKFGCDLANSPRLLRTAMNMGLRVVGITFHVGSLPDDPAVYASTIEAANDVYTYGEELGFHMHILDIGGGFHGFDTTNMTFQKVACVVNDALDTHFPASRGTELIAEPGRYFATTPFTVVVNIIAKKVVRTHYDCPRRKRVPTSCSSVDSGISENASGEQNESGFADSGDDAFELVSYEDDKTNMYYVNEGAYGVFNNVLTDHVPISPSLVTPPASTKTFNSVVWGPTCDNFDCLMQNCQLPELDTGHWLCFHNMGAYSLCLASRFNGIDEPERYYACSEEYWNKLNTASAESAANKSSSSGRYWELPSQSTVVRKQSQVVMATE